MASDFLTIRNLRKVYDPNTAGEVVALDNISFSIAGGEFVAIVGSNASGKTTLFNAIAGSIIPNSGEIILAGKSILNMPEYKRSRFISRVWQDANDSVVGSMTLAENLAIAKLKGQKVGLGKGVKKEWLNEFITILKTLDLGLEKRLNDKVDLLSGGQKQAVALVMATINEPELLLLDEHTAALDPKISKKVLEITDRLVREGNITTLMITHNIRHAIEYGNRLILLDRGNIGFESAGQEKQNLQVVDVIEKMER